MLSGLNSPDREDYILADRGNYAQYATGMKDPNEEKV
jgi:hypothetical protein